MNAEDVDIDPSWREPLRSYLASEAFDSLTQRLTTLRAAAKVILPKTSDIYKAFEYTPWSSVKVVILGQDPYHKEGQAMGLSFSVPRGVRVPPSLRNIYKELQTDMGCSIPTHGDLSTWAKQGVLLLNALLTVEQGRAGSHKSIGWLDFTDHVIKTISSRKDGIIFLLWGNFAKSKAALIDRSKHHVLEAAHPSPLARGAFFGSKPFSKTNQLLIQQGKNSIQWQID